MNYYLKYTKFNRKALSQVYGIISECEEEDIERIPLNIRRFIEDNRDKEYEFIIDDIEENNIELLEDTKKILAYIYTDFLSTPEEKEVLKKIENIQYRKKNEKNIINAKQDGTKEENLKSEIEMKKEITEEEQLKTDLVEYKENAFLRIIRFIKRFFERFIK